MTRRFALAAGLLVAVASLSSCSTFNRSDTAAEIGGEQLTRAELNTLTGGATNGDTVRTTITRWLQLGVLGGDTSGIQSAEELASRITAAEAKIAEPFMDAARTNYQLGVNGAPALCLRAFPIAAPITTEQVLKALKGGTSFVDAAKQYSSNTSLAAIGALVVDPNNNECIAPSVFDQALPGLMDQLKAANAVPGTPVAVSLTNQSNAKVDIIVLIRPFDDLKQRDKIGFAQNEIGAEEQQLFGSAHIHVNSRYGRWDPASISVVPLGNG